MTGCYFSIFLFIYSSLIQYIPTVASPPFTPMFSLPTSPLFQIHYFSSPLRKEQSLPGTLTKHSIKQNMTQ